MIRLKNLTASQTTVLDKVVAAKTTDFVVSTATTTAVLNGTIAHALAAIQSVMDEIRETEGGRSGNYRPLVSLRNKLEAGKAGKSNDVNVVPNGANVSGEVPDVLKGAPAVATDARPGAEVVPEPVAVSTPSAPPDNAPDFFDLGTVRANWDYMRRNAPSPAAENYWLGKLESLPS